MGKTALIYSVRPESPETDLEGIKKEIKEIKNFSSMEEKPFMFGMKQIQASFILPEGSKPDDVEEKLTKIKGVEGINQEACTVI